MRQMRRGPAIPDELDALAARPWRLRFPDPLERAYREDHVKRWLVVRRLSLIAGLVALAGFGIIDRWAAPEHRVTLWSLRALGSAAVLSAVLLSYTRLFLRIGEGVTVAAIIVVAATIAAMELVMTPGDPGFEVYVFGMVTAMFFALAATRLRFPNAVLTGTLTLAMTAIVGIAHHPYHAMLRFYLVEAMIVAAYLMGVVAAFFIEAGARQNFVHERQLERERARSDALLTNILPKEVAERLKRGESIADSYDDITVLFADLVNFTAMSERMHPSELIAFLDQLFTGFDHLADANGLEKIKTIGDSYMAVCGLPAPRDGTAAPAIDMAIEMLAATDRARRTWNLDVRLRIGINTGPVVAGVLGVHKFSYDLWGDTVNVASRMESTGEPGAIQVSEATYRQARGRYPFGPARIVDVKGKGRMITYLLEGGRTSSGDRAASAVG